MSHSKFIQMCVLSGCDYLNSPKGIGIKTAYQLLQKFKDAKEIIENYDKELEENYIQDYMCAYLAFKFSKVYCPKQKKIVSLNQMFLDNVQEIEPFDYMAIKIAKNYDPTFNFLGKSHSDEIAFKIANAQINPKTLQEYSVREILSTVRGKSSKRKKLERLLRKSKEKEISKICWNKDLQSTQEEELNSFITSCQKVTTFDNFKPRKSFNSFYKEFLIRN